MIARISTLPPPGVPISDESLLQNESDVEQKVVYPLLCNPNYLDIPVIWLRTKEYLPPTDIDKGASKRTGYIPDYSIWCESLPIILIEAKSPDVKTSVGLREARFYATELNKRYPPKVNPVRFIIASNGIDIALSHWDSESEILTAAIKDLLPGSSLLASYQQFVGKDAIQAAARETRELFHTPPLFSVSSSFSAGQLSRQLGVNEFAQDLFPILTRYFGNQAEDATDEIIERAYVSSNEVTQYEGVLETFLKDRVKIAGGNTIQPIVTSRSTAAGLSSELQKYAANPSYFGRVQLIIGGVGSGKSTFVRRYYKHLMPKDLIERTRWAFIDFNVMPPDVPRLEDWISEKFLQSFEEINGLDINDLHLLEKIFSVELNRFEKGPAKLVKRASEEKYLIQKAELLNDLLKDKIKLTEAVARHFSGERNLALVTVFDNVDKRDRDTQLKVFEAAQWLKDLTKSLVLVNLRDTTFEAHRDEPPLDAFINAINFFIVAPRFAQVIRKRLELVLERLSSEIRERQYYPLETGIRISYPSSRLGSFLISIYLSLFDTRTLRVASALEALVAKDVRRALGMFADIIISPHIPTSQITSAALTPQIGSIQEYRIIRALMRGRYKYFGEKSGYIKNILRADARHRYPSNLIYVEVLEYLIRNRKKKIDYSVEGYALVRTIVASLSRLGFDADDVLESVRTLVSWGLIEPETLVLDSVDMDDAVRVHASGFIHMRFFLTRMEYVVGVSPNMNFTSRDLALEIADIWLGQDHLPDLAPASRRRITHMLYKYFEEEVDRRGRQHPLYAQNGIGAKAVLTAMSKIIEYDSRDDRNVNMRHTWRST